MPSYFFLISTYTRSPDVGVPYQRRRSFSLYRGFSKLRAIRSRVGVSKYRLVMRVPAVLVGGHAPGQRIEHLAMLLRI